MRPLRLISNRLPISIQHADNGDWNIKASSGGLVTALRPILKQYGGSWVGWLGDAAEDAPVGSLLEKLGTEMGCGFVPVQLDRDLVEGFYYGFSNETLWPLFHDLLGHATFEESKWRAYVRSNEVFADKARDGIRPDEVVWIHDYQLMLLGQMLRAQDVRNPLAFFLHIPFPSPDIFARLPWRSQIVRALLAHDLVGFQQVRDLRNFVQCVKLFIPEASVFVGRNATEITHDGVVTRAGAFPISIDYKDFDARARTREAQDAAWYIHENLPDRQLMLGVDRLDYSKGIPHKFLAYERALEKYPDLIGKVSLIQVVIPSRQDVPEYARWKEKLDTLVGNINGRFADRGWIPLHYMYRSLAPNELLGYYRAAEIMLVTSLKDGMNLVAKEYCASSVDENGVLVLSEFAGAAAQLANGALIVNPHDCEGVADAIHRAYTMEPHLRRERMKTLRDQIRRHDVFRWVESFLDQVSKARPAAPV